MRMKTGFSLVRVVYISDTHGRRNAAYPPRFAHDEALREFHRVLVPGGILGMIWNVEDC